MVYPVGSDITTDPIKLPGQSTSFVIANLQGKRSEMKKNIGNLIQAKNVGRTWVSPV